MAGKKRRVKHWGFVDGKPLRSGLELKTYLSLVASKSSFKYEPEKLSFTVPSTECIYTPDFVVKRKGKPDLYVECKGRWDVASRKKMQRVTEQHPDKDIRMLFERDNTISKTSKITYSMWAAKNGIPYAVSPDGSIPTEWLK